MSAAVVLAMLLAGADPAPRVEGKPLDPADLPAEHAHEPVDRRPSGFWIGHRRARGDAYRWPLLGIGVGVLAMTAGGVVVLLRRASRERSSTVISS
jgi:hypothetical protein